jgi:hemoglobin
VGGFATIASVVSRFYELVLADCSLAHYFGGVNMERLIDHQTRLLCGVTGGPATFSDASLLQAHARLRVTTQAFDNVIEHLVEALAEHSFGVEDVDAIVVVLQRLRPVIVTA